jgi:quercetin dioxygenase-like cupin family protein
MATSTTTRSDTSGPVLVRPGLENSIWYGSAIFSFLATAEMTGGRYSLQRMVITRGFAPPAPHRHGPEDFYIIRGQVHFWVADSELTARAGDFVRTPPGVWHTFQAESDEAEMLLIFSPAGMQQFFQQLGKPAEAMELPEGRVGPPDPARLRELGPKYGIEFAPPGKTAREMAAPSQSSE